MWSWHVSPWMRGRRSEEPSHGGKECRDIFGLQKVHLAQPLAPGSHLGAECGTQVCKDWAGPCCWELQPQEDGRTDGQTGETGWECGESQGDNRTGWLGSTAETRDWMAASPVDRKHKVVDDRRDGWNDRCQRGPAVPCSAPGAGLARGDTGSQPQPPFPPSRTPPQSDAGAHLCLHPASSPPVPARRRVCLSHLSSHRAMGLLPYPRH